MSAGTAMPKMANLPRFLGENRKVRSTTSRAYPFASTNWLGLTSVGMRGPAIAPVRAQTQCVGGTTRFASLCITNLEIGP